MDLIDHPPEELKVGAQDALRRIRQQLAHTRTPEYLAELRRQAAILRDTPEDREAEAFIEAAGDFGDA